MLFRSSLAASQALRFGGSKQGARRIFFDSIAGTSSAAELPARGDCPVCAQFGTPARISRGPKTFAAAVERDAPGAEIHFPEPVILSTTCKSCGNAAGVDAPLLWRAADLDSRLADCRACGESGSVDIQIRDKIPARTLAGHEDRLPLRFAMVAADRGTDVFVFEQERPDAGR